MIGHETLPRLVSHRAMSSRNVLRRRFRSVSRDSTIASFLPASSRVSRQLRPLDEPDPLHAVFGISPDAVQGPFRFRDQASALIVADGLHVYTRGTRKPPDGEVSIHEFH